MEICKSKAEFMERLDAELEKGGIPERQDILNDFEQHFAAGFANGQTEADVCRKLGDITLIAKQYYDEDAFDGRSIPVRVDEESNTYERINPPSPSSKGISLRKKDEDPSMSAKAAMAEDVMPGAAAVSDVMPNANVQDVMPGGAFSGSRSSLSDKSDVMPGGSFAGEPLTSQQIRDARATDIPNPDGQTFSYSYSYKRQPEEAPAAAQTSGGADIGKLIACLCVDVFVFAWAIPALASVIAGYCAIPIAFVVSGFAALVGGIVSFFATISFVATALPPLAVLFLGIMLIALGGLATLLAIIMIKGFIKICISIINWHSMAIVGRRVINMGKKSGFGCCSKEGH